jgi:hypothetical protein
MESILICSEYHFSLVGKKIKNCTSVIVSYADSGVWQKKKYKKKEGNSKSAYKLACDIYMRKTECV